MMSFSLDGQNLFDEDRVEIELGSSRRDSIERTAAGLDGAISIDLGGRGRGVKEKGVLRAWSKVQMKSKVDAISAFMDGDSHTLQTGDGQQYGNLRMDMFKVSGERESGAGVACDYEIVYRQLTV